MLVNKGYTQGDVVSVKLLGGEEIIARFEGENDKELIVSKPMSVVPGHQGLGMMPWMFLAITDRDIKIRQTAIVAIADPKKDAADQYLQGTTGIALA